LSRKYGRKVQCKVFALIKARRKKMRKIVIAALLVLTVVMMLPARAMAQEAGGAKLDMDRVMNVVAEALDKINVEKLIQENSTVFEKYKFSDEDVAELRDATKSFTGSMSDYVKAYKAAAPDNKLPAPHDCLKDYCSKLQAFLQKYNVTCEDVLTVSKAAALMIMSNEDNTKKTVGSDPANAADKNGKLPTQEEIQAAFDSLLDFSRKYQILSADLVPLIRSICDIGLTVLENRVDIKKALETEGYWRTKVSALGASKEQADDLFKSAISLKRKYNMKIGDIKKLGDNISSQLKISPGVVIDKEADKESNKEDDKKDDKESNKEADKQK
jgi:hypothetical protein